MSDLTCNQHRKSIGLAYPRSCQKCGLGPCQIPVSELSTQNAAGQIQLALNATLEAIQAAEDVLETLIDANDGRLLAMRASLRVARHHLDQLSTPH
jgi:hypothetical protein